MRDFYIKNGNETIISFGPYKKYKIIINNNHNNNNDINDTTMIIVTTNNNINLPTVYDNNGNIVDFNNDCKIYQLYKNLLWQIFLDDNYWLLSITNTNKKYSQSLIFRFFYDKVEMTNLTHDKDNINFLDLFSNTLQIYDCSQENLCDTIKFQNNFRDSVIVYDNCEKVIFYSKDAVDQYNEKYNSKNSKNSKNFKDSKSLEFTNSNTTIIKSSKKLNVINTDTDIFNDDYKIGIFNMIKYLNYTKSNNVDYVKFTSDKKWLKLLGRKISLKSNDNCHIQNCIFRASLDLLWVSSLCKIY